MDEDSAMASFRTRAHCGLVCRPGLGYWVGRMPRVAKAQLPSKDSSTATIGFGVQFWIAEDPDHMIHFDGERFLARYPGGMRTTELGMKL